MADSVVARSRMAELERRLGITPIEELLAERDRLVEEVAELYAEHGPFGTWEHRRKIELARIAQLVRAQRLRDGVKSTAAEIDDAAREHPDYHDLVVAATTARARLYKLESRIENVDQTIQRANAMARYAAAEARL